MMKLRDDLSTMLSVLWALHASSHREHLLQYWRERAKESALRTGDDGRSQWKNHNNEPSVFSTGNIDQNSFFSGKDEAKE